MKTKQEIEARIRQLKLTNQNTKMLEWSLNNLNDRLSHLGDLHFAVDRGEYWTARHLIWVLEPSDNPDALL